MERSALSDLLGDVAEGRMSPAAAAARLESLPFEDVGVAKIDHHRDLRGGLPEVILGLGKTPEECGTIAARIVAEGDRLLATRVDAAQATAICAAVPAAMYHERARCVVWRGSRPSTRHAGVLICSAGTADTPVAEEAALTAELMDCDPVRLYDVGVAGLQRLLQSADQLRAARAIVVVAGMDGALSSVVAGLTAVPVVAVPTSVGYGAAFEGLAALLSMLNACAPGVTVVNIDNGFGAGYVAASIAKIAKGTAVNGRGGGPAL